jgi:hypothetical protein
MWLAGRLALPLLYENDTGNEEDNAGKTRQTKRQFGDSEPSKSIDQTRANHLT